MHLPEHYLENNSFSEAGSYIAQAGLELYIARNGLGFLILLLLPPKCWGSRWVPPLLVHAVLGMEPRASCRPSKHSTN